MAKKKVLIVYEKMGMGHLRMANILEDMLKEEDVEVIKYAGSEMIQDTSINIIVKLWNFLVKKNFIKTVDLLLNFITRIFILPFMEVSTDAEYQRKLEEINPDIIISTADGFNKAIGSYAKEKGIPFFIFITEVSIFIDLVNPYATHICYFNETGKAIQSYDFNNTYYSHDLNINTTFWEKVQYVLNYYKDFVIYGYKNSIFRNPDTMLQVNNKAKYRVIGPLAERKHFNEKDVEIIKDKYGFNNGMDTVVLASGSIGGKVLLELVKVLYNNYDKPLNLIVVCGNDDVTYNKIKNYDGISFNINLMPVKYLDNFDEVIYAADCVVGRPSAGIFIESLINKTPEITFRRSTSNDKGTLTMIEKFNIGKVVGSKYEIVEAIEDILSNKKQYNDNIEKLLNSYCRNYEGKKELLREIIYTSQGYNYRVDEDFTAEVGFHAPISR